MSLFPKWFIGEFVGTFLVVFFGCGSICTAVTSGATAGVFQVAIVWGLGIAIAIYLTSALSGAHLNPAVTLSLATWTHFSKKLAAPYMVAQFCGAFVAAIVLYFIFSDALGSFEQAVGIARGRPGSEASAMVFGEFFPNPGGRPLTALAKLRMSAFSAFAAEAIATAILLLVFCCVTDKRNHSHPKGLTALTIGLTVTLLMCLLSPFTMGCFNPARDLGPRVFSSLAGWGTIPFQVNGLGWLTVYIIGPLLGGWLGGAVYYFCFKKAYQEVDEPEGESIQKLHEKTGRPADRKLANERF